MREVNALYHCGCKEFYSENALTGEHTTTRISVIDHLDPTDSYDVVLVTVRLDQLASVLPSLAANHQIPTVLFMLNNPAGMQCFAMLDPQRVVLGFPSIGGSRQGDLVRYAHHPALAQTMLGKEDGHIAPRLRLLATTFKKAGFSVALNSDMQSWLKTHAIIDACILAAVVMTQGSSAKLGRTRTHVVMMVQAIHEGLRVLQTQGIAITPFSMKVLFLGSLVGWQSSAGNLSCGHQLRRLLSILIYRAGLMRCIRWEGTLWYNCRNCSLYAYPESSDNILSDSRLIRHVERAVDNGYIKIVCY